MSNQNIPSVDLADFLSGDAARKQAFVQKLGNAFETIGFVAVKNHFLTDKLSEDLYERSRDFFSLPEDVKRKYEIEGLAGQRGFTSFGKEHAKGKVEGDLKEFWHFGQELDENDALRSKYPNNIKVDEVPGFHNAGINAYKALEKTGVELLRAIALYLGLDENYFDSKVEKGESILRPIHYGPIQGEPKNAVRAAEHEDINLITLLMGASAEGLEVMNKNNEWVPVTALPEQIVVNVGDMLQRLTNNKLRSTTHRVVNPPKEKWATPRYSMPFFMHPRAEMKLNCLDCCIDENHPKQFDDITAGEYLDERLREIGLKK